MINTKTKIRELKRIIEVRVDFEKIILIINLVSISKKQSTPRNARFSLDSSLKKKSGTLRLGSQAFLS